MLAARAILGLAVALGGLGDDVHHLGLRCHHLGRVLCPGRLRAKREGYRSRAAYKLEEIDDKHHLLRPGQKVLDLGERIARRQDGMVEAVRSGRSVAEVMHDTQFEAIHVEHA